MLRKWPVRPATAIGLAILAMWILCAERSQAQAALLLEEPYGFFGALNPTGHTAIYFSRICAETPVKLRRCNPGEPGTIISRYQGIAGYDWVAMPPHSIFLRGGNCWRTYPRKWIKATVRRLRNHYHEQHLGSLGEGVLQGNLVRGGWTQLVGVAFERRTYAFRFATTDEQDDAIIARLNADPNRSNFNLVYNNCADWARQVLNVYFPRTFRRNFFPDAGMTTPKQITYKLTRYSRKHPEIELERIRDCAGSGVPAPEPLEQERVGFVDDHRVCGADLPDEPLHRRWAVSRLRHARPVSFRARSTRRFCRRRSL